MAFRSIGGIWKQPGNCLRLDKLLHIHIRARRRSGSGVFPWLTTVSASKRSTGAPSLPLLRRTMAAPHHRHLLWPWSVMVDRSSSAVVRHSTAVVFAILTPGSGTKPPFSSFGSIFTVRLPLIRRTLTIGVCVFAIVHVLILAPH